MLITNKSPLLLITILLINMIIISESNVAPFDYSTINLVMKDKTPSLFLLTTSSSDSTLLYTFHQAA